MEKEKTVENKQTQLVPLESIYTAQDRLELFIINNEKTRLRHIITNEIKPLEDEIRLYDCLMGTAKNSIDEKILADIRVCFRIVKQIGFAPQQPYDFNQRRDKDILCKLSTLEGIQKSANELDQLRTF